MRKIRRIVTNGENLIRLGEKHKEFANYRLDWMEGEVANGVLEVRAIWCGPNPDYKAHIEYYTFLGDVAVQWEES